MNPGASVSPLPSTTESLGAALTDGPTTTIESPMNRTAPVYAAEPVPSTMLTFVIVVPDPADRPQHATQISVMNTKRRDISARA
jgi:hypothetical protein